MGWRRAMVTAAATVGAVLLIGGCTSTAPETAPSATPPAARATTTPVPIATPTPTASTPQTAEPVAKTVSAGTVSAGTTATASTTGPANVSYTRGGDFAVVIALDCSACTGTVTVTAPGRLSPFGEAAAPVTGQFLQSVLTSDPEAQTLIVNATGTWTVTLQSWNDLTPATGPRSGKGPAVLYLADDVAHLRVAYTRAAGDDSFSGRIFTTSGSPLIFGEDASFTKTYDTDLPGVIAIQTNGSWTLTPVP